MSELVQRLREPQLGQTPTHMVDLVREAADELERMKQQLERAVEVGEKLAENCKEWEGMCSYLKTELAEQARVNGMGGSRELKLMADKDNLLRTLINIRDATHTNAITLRGMADTAINKVLEKK